LKVWVRLHLRDLPIRLHGRVLLVAGLLAAAVFLGEWKRQ